MNRIDEIKDRLNAVAFSGRSYPGASREEVKAAYNAVVVAFEANAAVDIAYLIDRVRELQAAIVTAAAELTDAAGDIAGNYAANDEEVAEIRVNIGDPVDKLIAVAQGTSVQPEEGAK
ncbi:hypothetical protein [uncultured Actinomyces sp.]|uniref:hypothetical protein n=1 Tax=uncultured Actinomyces sp. TaxID=249061 RepID=UPI0028F0AD4A|nr:hypothetical protein [uncultured Actinomyces sp.]